MNRPVQIVILGGGFAGLSVAMGLEKALARGLEAEITLVSRENFLLFTPMLHEVAASDVEVTHIVNPVRRLLRRVRFFLGQVESVDLSSKQVVVTHGETAHAHHLPYDHLVLALGNVTNFYGLKSAEGRSLTMKSLSDAIHVRNRLIENLEAADYECQAELRNRLMTVLVAGGGFSGVETAAAINDFLREALKFYPRLRPEMLRLVLVHAGPYLLPELGEKLGRYAGKKLAQRGLEIHLDTLVTGLDEQRVHLSNGLMVEAGTVIWTAGTAPNPILEGLPCTHQRGKVLADACMRVPGWSGVWALGDGASIQDPWTGKPFPPTAQHALRQGKVLAANIVAAIQGRQPRAFRYRTLGQLAAIGRRTGVARILGVNFSGFFAWWMWRSIYLSKLPRLEKKLRVALDWTLDLVFSKDLVQFSTRPPVSSPPSTEATMQQETRGRELVH